MKKFKVLATNKETKERQVITMEDKNKTNFANNLRGNGYSFNNTRVKEEKVWNWLAENSGASKQVDNAMWLLNKIPENAEEFYDLMIKNLQTVTQYDKESVEVIFGKEVKGLAYGLY